MRIAVKTIESVTRHALVFTLIFTWVFSSWPQLFTQFPPKIKEVNATGEIKVIFGTAGNEPWEVPAGITSITVKAWGAGGAGGDDSNDGGSGGGGGFAQATFTVTPLENLTVYVGGNGVNGTGSRDGGGGGGYSAVTRGATYLVQAGGGGGGAGANSISAGNGGAGGGSSGIAGQSVTNGNGGGGGTQIGGGTGGNGGNGVGADGANGASNTGGQGGAGGGGVGGTNGGATGSGEASDGGGGGGGGGYFGGGGGESADCGNNCAGGGGGGGSDFVDCATCTAKVETAGSGATPGNNLDVDYTGSIGVGGAPGTDGNDGYVVISYTPGSSSSPWCSDGQYRRKMTVNSTKVAGSATSFPILVSRTDGDFRTTAWGGHAGSATGYDFVFTTVDCSVYDYEIEKYASSTGELVAWVRYPFLSTTSTNSLYVYYGNAAAEDQQNARGVWDSNFKSVWHMAATSTQLGNRILDSTVYSNTGTKFSATEPTATSTGKIDGGHVYDGSNDYVSAAASTNHSNLNLRTISAWIYPRTMGQGSLGVIVDKSDNIGPNQPWAFRVCSNDPTDCPSAAQTILFGHNYIGQSGSWHAGANAVTLNAWNHVVVEYSRAAGSQPTFFVNGSLKTTTQVQGTSGTPYDDSSNLLVIGNSLYNQAQTFDGIIDEVRISSSTRSISWIQTEYNNQSSPGTFLLFDTEDPLRGTYIDQYDILSDSRPGQTSNHTLQFIINNDITASTSLVFSWPDGFTMSAPTNWYSGSWQYRKKITLDSSKIAGNTDLTDFPVLVSSTQALWKSTENGGNVSSATGWDFVITASDGVTKLDHEIEKFASTTGELVAWFRAPTLDRNAINEYYIYYGGPSTTNQQNVHGVWDSNFKGVWHMTTTSSQTNISYDSTANSNTGTKFATNQPFSSSTGTINGAQDFDGVDNNVQIADAVSLQNPANLTFSAWIYPRTLGSANLGSIYVKENSGGWRFRLQGTNTFALSDGNFGAVASYNSITMNQWQQVAVVWNGSSLAAEVQMYVNGELATHRTADEVDFVHTGNDSGAPAYIGSQAGIRFFDGVIDEMRVSNAVRSASWIATEYNNQASPSTFHTIGNEEDNGIFDCGDVDVATGTEFTLGGVNDCWATATHWGVLFATSTRKLAITAPTNEYTHVATGTEITVQIGTNATSQFQGNSRITNPSLAGIYTLTLTGSAGSVGNFLVSINEGQTVSAVIAENLSLTVSSVYAVNCTADDGASVTAKVSASTTVAFGDISANTFYIACQDLILSTNAGGGYSLTTQENHPLMTGSGAAIADTTCNAGTCTEATSAAWTTATVNGFGHTCYNQSGADCNPVYANGDNFRQFANTSNGETAQPIMASTTPAIATGRVKFRLNRGTTQASGTYSNIITYIITATY